MGFDRALEVLAAADAELREAVPHPTSLAPGRVEATPMTALGESLLDPSVHDPEAADAFAQGLAASVRAMVLHFPDNIFWDVDFFGASLLKINDAPLIRDACRLVVHLQEGFGQHSEINFRYVHDFLFGYDWARWVPNDPDTRVSVGPFDLEFLEYLEHRRLEVLDLIAVDDEKYNKLPPDVPRNPFLFSREPQQERTLLEKMAADDLIPVKTWTVGGERVWDRDYTELRKQYAAELDIPVRPQRA